jgi:hypothetical protein
VVGTLGRNHLSVTVRQDWYKGELETNLGSQAEGVFTRPLFCSVTAVKVTYQQSAISKIK